MQAAQQARRHARPSDFGGIERPEFAFKKTPLKLLREPDERMLQIDLLRESRLKQMLLPLLNLTGTGLHREIATFCKN